MLKISLRSLEQEDTTSISQVTFLAYGSVRVQYLACERAPGQDLLAYRICCLIVFLGIRRWGASKRKLVSVECHRI